MIHMVKIGFTPSAGYILVKELEDNSEIVTANTQNSNRGKVMAIGRDIPHISGEHFIKPSVNVGDTIIFRPHTDKVNIDNEEYFIIPFDNIRGVLG